MTSAALPANYNDAIQPGRFLPLLVAGCVLAVFLALTWWLWKSAQDVATERIQASLEYEATATVQRIEQRMSRYEQLLRGVRGLFATSGGMDHAKFRQYIAQHDLQRHLPGIQGVGYAQIVPANEKSAHVARIRAEGFPGYDIRPDTARDTYAPIVYMEPMSGDNLKVFGFDPYSADVPRAAMDKARDLDTVISAKLRLQQDADRGDAPGFVMYMPVYRTGTKLDTTDSRRANILGWIDAPFNMKALVAAIEDGQPSRIAYSIHDGSEISPRTLMYASHGDALGNVGLRGHRYRQSLWIGDRNWTFVASPLPGSSYYNEYEQPLLIARMGVVLSLLMAWLAWLLANGRQRTLALARGMTRELRESEARLHAIIDNAAFGIVTIDASGIIESMNIAALQTFGYAREEVIGRNIGMLVPKPHRQRHDGYISNYLATGQSEIIGNGRELNGERKDGSIFPMLLVVSEMTINGRRAFTGIIKDITLRRQAQDAVLERTQELVRANNELLRFAEVSAHHLVEPIRRLGSYAQRLRTRLAQVQAFADDEDIQLSIDTLERDAARLRIMVRDIERYISAGLPSDQSTMSSVDQAMLSVRQQFSERLEAIAAHLQVSPLPAARLDNTRLTTLFSVLVDNCLLHGRPLDPDVALVIKISGELDGGISRYRVQDNGSGIPARYSERMFTIFERMGSAGGSTGIGLSIARRIVESRKGKIWIESAPTEGTCVVFEIPNGVQINEDQPTVIQHPAG